MEMQTTCILIILYYAIYITVTSMSNSIIFNCKSSKKMYSNFEFSKIN